MFFAQLLSTVDDEVSSRCRGTEIYSISLKKLSNSYVTFRYLFQEAFGISIQTYNIQTTVVYIL